MESKGKGVYQGGQSDQDESSSTSNIGSSQETFDLNFAPPNGNHIQLCSRTENNNYHNDHYHQQGHFEAPTLPLHLDQNITSLGLGIGHEPNINMDAPQLLGQPLALPNGACRFSAAPSHGASSSRAPPINGIVVDAASGTQGNEGIFSANEVLDLRLRLRSWGPDPNQQHAQPINEKSSITLSSGYSSYVLEESKSGEGRSYEDRRVSCKRKLNATGWLTLGDSSRATHQAVIAQQQQAINSNQAQSGGRQGDRNIPQDIMNRAATDPNTPLALNRLFSRSTNPGMRHNVVPNPSMFRIFPRRITNGVPSSSPAFITTRGSFPAGGVASSSSRSVNGPSHGFNYFSAGNFLPPNSQMSAYNANRRFQRPDFGPSRMPVASMEMERYVRGGSATEVQVGVVGREARRLAARPRGGNLHVGSEPLNIQIRTILIDEIRNALGLARRNGSLPRHVDGMVNGLHVLPEEPPDQYENMRLDVDNMSYEELLELEQRIGDVSTGLSEKVIGERMGKETFVSNKVLSLVAIDPCPICLDEYADGDDIGKLDCGHNFHFQCVKQWLRRKNTCPICKKALGHN